MIGAFEGRVRERDDATDLAFLGRLYLIRARRTNDLASNDQALAVLERARAMAPDYLEALGLLASARYALHDFTGAAELADRILDSDPANLDMLAVAGDAALAVGDVDEAGRVFNDLNDELPGNAAVLARLSQLAWLEGDAARAAALAATADGSAPSSGALGADLAWYRNYRGALAFDQGRLRDAAARFEEALGADPSSPVALGGLAAVSAAGGRYEQAIALYREAVASVPDPGFLIALGDLYLLLGDGASAEGQYSSAEEISRPGADGRGVYNRLLATFYVDHNRNVAEALRLAEGELELRRDVGGWDAHAWALYRNGRFEDARESSDRALEMGTPEPEFWYHAGLISKALGEDDRAADELERALTLNPAFDPIHAAEARRALGEILGEPVDRSP